MHGGLKPTLQTGDGSEFLAGIEETTGKDVAGLIIQYLEKNAGPHLTRREGKC